MPGHITRPGANPNTFDEDETKRLAREARLRNSQGLAPQGATTPAGTPDMADRTGQGQVGRPGAPVIEDTGNFRSRALGIANQTDIDSGRRDSRALESRNARFINSQVGQLGLGDSARVHDPLSSPGATTSTAPKMGGGTGAGENTTLFDRFATTLEGSEIGRNVGLFNQATTVQNLLDIGVNNEVMDDLGITVDENGRIVDMSEDTQTGPNLNDQSVMDEADSIVMGIDDIDAIISGGGTVDEIREALAADFQVSANGDLLIQTPEITIDGKQYPIAKLPIVDEAGEVIGEAWGVLGDDGQPWFPAEAQRQGDLYDQKVHASVIIRETLTAIEEGRDAAIIEAQLGLLRDTRNNLFTAGQNFQQQQHERDMQDARFGEDRMNLLIQLQNANEQGDLNRQADLFNTLLGIEESRRAQDSLQDFQRESQVIEHDFQRDLQSNRFDHERSLQIDAQVHDIRITGIRERAADERAKLDRDLEKAIFEMNEGIRFGDFKTAKARKEAEIKLRNQQFALSVLEILGASPHLSGAILGSEIGAFLEEAGVDVANIIGDPGQSALDDLPSLADLQSLPFDQQQAQIRSIAAARGVEMGVVAAEIQRRASGQGLDSRQGEARRSLVA